MLRLIKIEDKNIIADATSPVNVQNQLCIAVASATAVVEFIDERNITGAAMEIGHLINPYHTPESKIRMGMLILNDYIGRYIIILSIIQGGQMYKDVIYKITGEPAANDFEHGMGPGMGGRYRRSRRSHRSHRSHRSRRSRKY